MATLTSNRIADIVGETKDADEIVQMAKALYDTLKDELGKQLEVQHADLTISLSKSLEAEATNAIREHLEKGMGEILKRYEDRAKQLEQSFNASIELLKGLLSRPMKKTISYDEVGRPTTIIEEGV